MLKFRWRSKLWTMLVWLVLVSVSCSRLSLSFPTREAGTPEAALQTPESLPPTVVEFTPRSGQEVPPDEATIMLRFSQAMDRESVEAALQVTPEVGHTASWVDDQTVQFRPEALETGTRYRVLLGTKARASNGTSLNRELVFTFSTPAPLEAISISPEDGSEDLRVDVPILVSFNRPVVPLNCVNQIAGQLAECPALPLTFEPVASGQALWVNTSLYRFDPKPGWAAGETYKVSLSDGVSSVDGVALEGPYRWSFSTALPQVLEVAPADGSKDRLLDAGVRVAFNTPMDSSATGSAFSVVSENGEPVPGTLTWEDEGAILVFTPTQQLALGTQYLVRVSDAARALTGAPLQESIQWTFNTVPYPSVVDIIPADGARGVELYQPIQIAFAGAIDETSIASKVTVTPDIDDADRYVYWDGRIFNLSWDKEPRTRYCVEIAPGVLDRYGNETQGGAESCFTTGDLSPLISPATGLDMITLDADAVPRVYMLSRNVGRVGFSLLEMTEQEFLSRRDTSRSIREWTEAFDAPPNKAAVSPVSLTRSGDPLTPGYYRLTWENPQGVAWWRDHIQVAVLDRHVTLKLSSEEALVWVTDLRTGEPITATEVRLLDENATLLAAGTTDEDGIARVRIGPLDSLWERVTAVVGSPGKAGFGIAMSDWNAGATPWDLDVPVDFGEFRPYNFYLYSDRPIYRPGQTVYFRGILREERDVRYTLPTTINSVNVRIRDTEWEIVYSNTLALSDMGSFAGAFELLQQAKAGYYTLQAEVPGIDSTWDLPFTVAAYRKPEFQVTVTPEQENILQEETVRALIDAQYFFGGAVSDTALHWTVQAQPFVFEPGEGVNWGWGNAGGGWWQPEVVAEGDATTDSEGRFLLELPAVLKDFDDSASVYSQRWTIEATLTDESGFSVSGRGSLTVHAAGFYLGLQPRQWVVPASRSTTLDLKALDWIGDPVAGQRVLVTLAQRDWYQVSPEEPFGRSAWGYTDTVISTLNVTTDGSGAAEVVLTPPKGGSYVVIAEAEDTEGFIAEAETGLWVSGPEGAAWQTAEGRVTPVADAKSYQPGDTASILVPTPFEGPFQVLMTVERGGILEVRRFVSDEANPLVEVPILPTYAPNVYVSFVVVKGVGLENEETEGAVPDIRLGMVELTVEPVIQTLSVEIVPDRTDTYAPGSPVVLTVRTVDSEGRTVDAEVGISLVDKAVLALQEPNAPTILEGFYGRQSLSVTTGDALLLLFNRIATDLEAFSERADLLAEELSMGGIGGGGAGALAQIDVRQEFPDTAFWKVSIRTGPSGEAQVSFPLPDSVTTWVVDARAVTADTKVGDAKVELVVNKPLLVRPVTPRFFVAGDRPELAAVVHNNTRDELSVTVGLETVGLVVEGDAKQTVIVPANGRVRVRWSVAVPASGSSAALLTFSAEGGEYADASRPTVAQDAEGTLPIYRFESPDTLGTTGTLSDPGSQVEAIAVPVQAGEDTELTVRLEPSLAAGMTAGLTYLERYPYDCTEQIVSRFLPNVLTYRALQDLGLDEPALEEHLDVLVPDALDRLYTRQNQDGGWGWWRETSDLQVSAYVAMGLWEAQQAGFVVRDDVLQRVFSYLSDTLRKDLTGDQRTLSHAMALYVLTLADQTWPEGAAGTLYAARDKLGVTGQAYLALALGIPDDADRRVKSLLDNLRGLAEITSTGAHWGDTNRRAWVTDTRATAVVLDALVRLAPQDTLIPQTVRWLMVARQGDRWTTTQESAWALIALTDFMVSRGELDADYSWGVALNAVPLLNGEVNTGNLREASEIRLGLSADPAGGLVSDSLNVLEIVHGEGSGSLYYTAQLALYLPVEDLQAESRGITVQRQYCMPSGAVEPLEGSEISLCEPLASVQPGDLVEVRLTLVVPESRYYLTVEDPYPAGMEPVDSTLLTEQEGLEESVTPFSVDSWQFFAPFEHRELRDDRAVFFAQALSAGTYHLSYYLRAAVPGVYHVLPARASEMYFPEVWGRTGGEIFQIQP